MRKAHIPEGKVGLCVIAAGFPKIRDSLRSAGVKVIETSPHNNLQKPVASHADMQLHYLGQGRAVIAKGSRNLMNDLESYGIIVQEEKISSKYPYDIKLNCFSLNKFLFCNEKGTSEKLLKYYQLNGAEVVHIKQGYAKCSTCIVDENSIITADKSIADAARSRGADVLQISEGGILLDGYDTGFIGGCCGLIDANKLAVCGKISKHRDYIPIKSFCMSKNVELIELTDCELTDIGGIIPIMVY